MNSVLLDILDAKRKAVERSKKLKPAAALEKKAASLASARDFAAAVGARAGTNIIAEIKRASPSAGTIAEDFDPAAIAADYKKGGAAAISVLTEEKYFRGDPTYVAAVKKAAPLPVLRKDFIFDEYQVLESRCLGADALLLIAAVLDSRQLAALVKYAAKLRIAPLVEVHDERELESALASGADLIGINNRDLNTLKVDLKISDRLSRLVPKGKTVVVESGIKTAADIERFKKLGINAFLIGETVMRSPDRIKTLKELAR